MCSWSLKGNGMLLCACVFAVAGCSGSDDPWPRVAVQGEVTLDGQPLAVGQITFFPVDGTKGPAAGGDITNGRFQLAKSDGPVVGTNRVEIRSVQKTGRMVEPPAAVEADGPVAPNLKVEEYADVIPKQYNTYSELKSEISPGAEQTMKFDLLSQPATSSP